MSIISKLSVKYEKILAKEYGKKLNSYMAALTILRPLKEDFDVVDLTFVDFMILLSTGNLR